MKRIYSIILFAAGLFLLSSCEEFDPVFTGAYDNPAQLEVETLQPTHTIVQLAALYTTPDNPVKIKDNIIIKGKVSTSDKQGNLYKGFYIQDETGGIEIKVGKNGLYNDYKEGQTVYIKCKGMTLGMYGYKSGEKNGNGMLSLGYDDPSGEYETSYIENPLLIDIHIIKGEYGDPVEPKVITAADLPGQWATLATCPYLGTLVSLSGLKYDNQIFNLLYLDSNKDKKASSNRIFLSDKTWGVTTWSMSKMKMKEYLHSGIWDSCKIGNSGDYNYGTVGDRRRVDEVTGEVSYPDIEKNAASGVSQYFSLGSQSIIIRTSGYSKFADKEIDPRILSGECTIDVTGILTMYQGKVQFTLIDLTGIKINE